MYVIIQKEKMLGNRVFHTYDEARNLARKFVRYASQLNWKQKNPPLSLFEISVKKVSF